MKALLYKDFVSAKSTYLLALGIFLVITTVFIVQGYWLFLPFLFVYIPIMFNAISFGVEEQANFSTFIFTTPMSRQTYVQSKYVLTLVISALALVSSLFIFYVKYDHMEIALLLGAITFFVPVFLASIQIPFLLKFGAEKGKIFMVAVYFLLFSVTSFVGQFFEDIFASIQRLSLSHPYLISLSILLLSFLILFLSIALGTRIIENKEF